jgi:FMN reductase
MRVVGIGGSMRERSYSRAALQQALTFAAEQGLETELLDVRSLDLPMYRPDIPVEGYPAHHHASIHQLLDACRQADAFIWSSPAYHGTVSGVFKNALDYVEYLNRDERPYLHGCPVGLIAVNDQVTFAAMINAAHELRAWAAPTQVVVRRTLFSQEMVLEDERTQLRMQRQLQELIHFAHRFAHSA